MKQPSLDNPNAMLLQCAYIRLQAHLHDRKNCLHDAHGVSLTVTQHLLYLQNLTFVMLFSLAFLHARPS